MRRHALALRLADDAPGDDVRARAFQGAALFVVAAFLNADDDATTVPTVLGDLLVLHATRDVRRGDGRNIGVPKPRRNLDAQETRKDMR